jgi:NADH-ubiquinone oxidoreductase chain 4
MSLSYLLSTPILGVLGLISNNNNKVSLTTIKSIALTTCTLNFAISLIIFIFFDFSTNQFQFVHETHDISYFDFFIGLDGLSIFFILLTTLIIPISIVSNWKSITKDVTSFVIIILLLEILLLTVFLVLDILLFYIFFESILPPLFILIGIFGSDNRVKASFYLFLYTLLGSLFLLLSILAMSSIMSTTDFDTLFKGNFIYLTQLFLFYGIFIAFAVKTPTIFLNTWLLKAHVESPLGGSIILAAIVLKLSLYGILRLILPVLPKAYMGYTSIIFLIGVITIAYASLSTLRTIDIKELIAYSSVSHAAVYLLGVFSNSIQGIEGSINLGLAHGLVSPGLFICAGGVLYDRSSTRVISFYRGVTQVMPLFAILFFILCLANCGAPLSLNFIGEFLSLYGVFERSSLFGVFASSSIIFSAAYTIYMYQRIAFGGVYSRMFTFSIPDLTKREFTVLLILVVPTVFFGIYPAVILDAVHYSVSTLIYSFDFSVISCDGPIAWGFYHQDCASLPKEVLIQLPTNIVYYLVGIYVLLLGIVCLSSSQTTDPVYDENSQKDPEPSNNPRCRHPVVERLVIKGPEMWHHYKNRKCPAGFKLMDGPYDYRGYFCNECGVSICPNPGCVCKIK